MTPERFEHDLRELIGRAMGGINQEEICEILKRETAAVLEQPEPAEEKLDASNSLLVRFIPQTWMLDLAVTTDDGEPVFRVGHVEIAALTGIPPDCLVRLESEDFRRDELRKASTAPSWVREWSGPFEIEIIDDLLNDIVAD